MPPVAVGSVQHKVNLAAYAEKLEDRDGRFTLDDVREEKALWQAMQASSLGVGFHPSVWWLRVAVVNDSDQAQVYFLDTGSAVADYVNIYVLREGRAINQVLSGDRRPFHTRPINTHTVVVPVELAARESAWLYIRLDTWDGLHEAISLLWMSEKSFAGELQTEALAQGIYYGTLIAILLYNLFLFLFIRERVFGRYVFYVAAFLLWSYIFRGYGLQYLWPNSPYWNNQILPIAASICYVSFGLFALEYLNIRQAAPQWMYRGYWLAIGLNLLATLPAFFGYYALTFAISLPLGVMMVVMAVSSGVWMMRQGSRPAKYFLIAFGFLALGGIDLLLPAHGFNHRGAAV
ncbi:MAG: 7TMR-DISM family protein [Oceanococcus sp.]